MNYQRMLIPYNLVVIVLALVAAFTLFFSPLITIDVGKLVEVVEEAMEDSAGTDEEGGSSPLDALSEIKDLKVSITVKALWEFSSGNTGESVLGSVVGSVIGGSDSMNAMIADVAIPYIIDQVDLDQYGISDVKGKLDTSALVEKIGELEGNPSESDKARIENEFAELIASQLGIENMTDETRAAIVQQIDNMYEDAIEETGSFTVEAGICVAASKAINESNGESDGTVYKTYDEFLGHLLASSGMGASFVEMLDKAADMVKYFVYGMFFFIGIWLLMALFALIHLLLPNKRFMTWYVKLFGGFPCLLFGVLPLVAKYVVGNMEGMAMLVPVLGAISTMTWVSGACWLVLVLLGWFWAGPIKRRIKRGG